MRRSLVATILILFTAVGIALSGSLPHSFAQVGQGLQGDEFNGSGFQAPFKAVCASAAAQPCPDTSGPGTWSVNNESAGQLRIWSLFGSLVGSTTQASNSARNMILQPVDPAFDWTVTTKLTFPAASNTTAPLALGQTAGILVYQNDDNFIYIGRQYSATGIPQIQFLQETGGTDYVTSVPETGIPANPIYVRLSKTGTLYQAYESTDNVNFTQIPPALPTPTATVTLTPTGTTTATAAPTLTSTPQPTGYTGVFSAPQVGLFAWGGTDSRVNNNLLAADFDWFRIGTNSQTPAPTVAPTSTNTPVVTNTSQPTATNTATATSTATATATAIPTNTPKPTPTPKPRNTALKFSYVSLWYHTVRQGTWDFLDVQGNHHRQLGIWVHVYFPNGRHYDYYANTDAHGRWQMRFNIPRKVVTAHSNLGLVTVQLWEGNKTRKEFINFTLL